MPTYSKRPDFITSEKGIMAATALNLMVLDSGYTTEPSFSVDSEKYADNLMPFTDKHLTYLQNNPTTNLDHYLSNLKLKTRVR